MPDVQVNLAAQSYTIRIEPGLLQNAGTELRAISDASKAVIITDHTVAALHLPTLMQSLWSARFEPIVALLNPGEQHKSLSELLPVYDTILSARIERNTPLLALGGGIVGDMSGFVAATALRGIPLVQIPTTLLAMVDSSVGGKTGVNHPAGKNLIGAFHQPVRVLVDPQLLTTLPRQELIGGLAECIKHEVIRDADGFRNLEQKLDLILELAISALTDLIVHNVQIKTAVVEADPLEQGERAHLNFGHTFGHAIEKVSGHRYSHGQAVALGMIAASRLAVDLGLLELDQAQQIMDLIHRAGLPTQLSGLAPREIAAAMAFDKKVVASKIRLILPDRIGHVIMRNDVELPKLLSAISQISQ